MKNFIFSVIKDTSRTTRVDLILPTGTKSGKLYFTPNNGVEVEVVGGVNSIADDGVTIVVPSSLATPENSPGSLRLAISVNGGEFNSVASGRMYVVSAPVTSTGIGADTARQINDATMLAALNAKGSAENRRAAGQANFDYQDSVEFLHTNATLTGVPAAPTAQVSGNKVYSTSTTTAPNMFVPLSRNIAWGEKFHLTTFIDQAAVSGSSYVFFGIAFGDKGLTTTAGDDTVTIGFTNTGVARAVQGASVGGVSGNFDQNISSVAGRYNLVIDSDGENISLTLRHRDDNTKTVALWTLKWSNIATNKVIGRLIYSVVDSRALNGHSIGPIALNYGSLQPHRTKTVGGHLLEGAAYRDIKRYSTSGPQTDMWRLALPKNYDPRKPSPLIVYFHPAGSSTATVDRPWNNTAERGVTNALLDAGYIVVTSQDGYVTGQPNTDRYANDVSMAEMTAVEKWARSQFAVSQTGFFGVSMGMITGTNLLARRTVPNVGAAYFIDGGLKIKELFLSTDPVFDVYKTPVRTAYGIAIDNSNVSVLDSRDSSARPWYDFRGIPVRAISGSTDAIAPAAYHIEFVNKLAPYVSEASQQTYSGAHAASNHHVPSDVLAFFNKHLM